MIYDSDTTYKLMILYMLNKLDGQLTNAQLSQFFIDYNYTDYFNFQQTLNELVESDFVEKNVVRNTSYYNITSEGYETLTYFKSSIPGGVLEDINKFIEENKFELKNEVGTQSNYYKHTNGDYIVNCQVMEGRALLYEVNISVPSEDEAKRISSNWNAASEDIYSFLMKTLLQ